VPDAICWDDGITSPIWSDEWSADDADILLAALMALFHLFASSNAAAQPTNSVDRARDRADLSDVRVPCGEKTEIKEEIAVGATARQQVIVGLSDNRDCGGDGSPASIVLGGPHLRFGSPIGPYADTRTCPAFAKQAELLRPSPRPPGQRSVRAPPVRVGPFVIRDGPGYFDLKHAKGRSTAAGWVRQTLAAVHPCLLDSSDDPAELRRVRRLYAALGPMRQ